MKGKSKQRLIKGLGQAAYADLAAIGAAPGGSRAHTFKTKKEKALDPKRQRKEKRWLKDS